MYVIRCRFYDQNKHVLYCITKPHTISLVIKWIFLRTSLQENVFFYPKYNNIINGQNGWPTHRGKAQVAVNLIADTFK